MTIAWSSFTPISTFLGGCLIGFAALLLMVFQGRIMGVSGIIVGLFGTASLAERGWQLAFLLGGGVLVNATGHRFVMKCKAPIQSATFSMPTSTNIDKRLVIGCVGFGMGSGLPVCVRDR